MSNTTRRIKNNKVSGADYAVNEFFRYGGCDKLLKIMDMIFEKGEVPVDFRKTLIKPICKKGGKSECDNYRSIILISVVGKVNYLVW